MTEIQVTFAYSFCHPVVAPPVDTIYRSPSIDEYQAFDRPAPKEINYETPPAPSVDEYSAPVQYSAPAGHKAYQPPPPVHEPYQLPQRKTTIQ